MYSDLRMWEEAKQYSHTASADTAHELVKRQVPPSHRGSPHAALVFPPGAVGFALRVDP